MLSRDISFDGPDDNLLFDELLLARAEDGSGPETLRLWESPSYFVVLGRIGKPGEDCRPETILADRVPVCRRASGGGTVLQGPGCLNFSLVVSKDRDPALRDIRGSYEWILNKVIALLAPLGVAARFFPVSDLGLSGDRKKFSGNAQKRGRQFILHHGTILYDFDLDLISRYLRHPPDQPAYRNNRPHHEFVTNLPRVPPAELKEAFRRAFGCQDSRPALTAEDKEELRLLREQRQVFIVLGGDIL
jgi:lipoate-protein ligase A